MFFNRIYAIVLVLAIVIGAGLFMQYKYYEAAIHEEVENSIGLKLDYMDSEVERYFSQSVEAIESIELMLQTTESDDKILYYLEKKLKATPSYTSLYFGTPDNHMINGSGWIPPDTFDLRTRPWYVKATEEKDLITTAPYLNASKTSWIVTFAKPVYDRTGKFIGVVGGDNSLKSIVNILRDQRISRNGFVFFLDSDGKLIMHSKVKDIEKDEANTEIMLAQLDKSIQETGEGVSQVDFDGESGFLAWNTIDETGWVVGNFSPLSDFIDSDAQESFITWVTLVVAAISIAALFIVQRRYIIQPLLALNKDIKVIAEETDFSYRLPITSHDTFADIRQTINGTLEKTQDCFDRMVESKKALEASERKNSAIVNVLPDLIFIYNKEGVFLDCMENRSDGLYVEKEFFIGQHLYDIMPKDVADKGMNAITTTLQTGELQLFDYSLKMPGGIEYFETRMIKVASNEVLAIVRNITESKEYLNRIEHLSFHDQLTGLYNRRFYEEELKRLDTPRNLPLTLVMLDVNGLKLTNDAFGHIAGDNLLKSVAKALKSQCRADDIIARIGGDEFIIILPATSSKEAESIIKRIDQETMSYEVANIPLSISIGWDTKINEYESIMDIFVKAEDQMYRKKLTESQSMRNRTIKVILETLNTKDEREKVHSENVSKISKQIGEALNVGYETLKEIEVAGLMHDIGKIAISEGVLNKPGSLTEAEYVEVMKHPESGYQILKSVDTYSSLAEYALSHHERWDGKGYPKGLIGKEIPLISRIIAIADAYEAMTSDRSYRLAMPKELALEEIKRCSGSQFDPQLVRVFLDLFEEK